MLKEKNSIVKTNGVDSPFLTCSGMLQPSCCQRNVLQAGNHLCLRSGTFQSKGHLQNNSSFRTQAKICRLNAYELDTNLFQFVFEEKNTVETGQVIQPS